MAKVNGYKSPTNNTFRAMWERCTDRKNGSWKNYGGRGVRVCARWRSYETFLRDMGPKPSRAHSIERIDNSKGYSPANCRWATVTEQNRNRRSVRLSMALARLIRKRVARGESKKSLARAYGVSQRLIQFVAQHRIWKEAS